MSADDFHGPQLHAKSICGYGNFVGLIISAEGYGTHRHSNILERETYNFLSGTLGIRLVAPRIRNVQSGRVRLVEEDFTGGEGFLQNIYWTRDGYLFVSDR